MFDDLSWAVGLFEGEGSVGINVRKAENHHYLGAFASLGSTDLDVLTRFHSVVKLGAVRTHHPRGYTIHHLRDARQWGTGRHEDIVALHNLFASNLGRRRANRFREVMEIAEAYRERAPRYFRTKQDIVIFVKDVLGYLPEHSQLSKLEKQ